MSSVTPPTPQPPIGIYSIPDGRLGGAADGCTGARLGAADHRAAIHPNRHRVRGLFLIAVLALLAGALFGTASPVGAQESLQEGAYFHPDFETDAHQAINQIRARHGLAPLTLQVTSDGSLPIIEDQWRRCIIDLNASTMARNGQLTHDPSGICRPHGRQSVLGEQILSAMWSTRATNAAQTSYNWMRSPGHMAWILSPDANAIRVYAACYRHPGPDGRMRNYMVVGATLLRGSSWSSPKATSTAPVDPVTSSGTRGCDEHTRTAMQQLSVPTVHGPSNSHPWEWEPYQIARLYAAYFDRVPDREGWIYWIDQMTPSPWRQRLGLEAASHLFSDSAEFRNTYGSAMSNHEFMDLVYRNVMRRAPDPSGHRYWVNELAGGRLSRSQLMIQFSESEEFRIQTGQELLGSCWNQQNITASYLCGASRVVPR